MEKSKRNFKTKFLLQTVPLQEILQQNLILSTKKNPFLWQDDSLQINFQQNQILPAVSLPINSNRPFRFPHFLNLIWY